MANQRDKNKRLKGFGIPVEVCVKYERLAGVKANETPTKKQAKEVTDLMVKVLIAGVSHVTLTSEDYAQIAKEVQANENR